MPLQPILDSVDSGQAILGFCGAAPWRDRLRSVLCAHVTRLQMNAQGYVATILLYICAIVSAGLFTWYMYKVLVAPVTCPPTGAPGVLGLRCQPLPSELN